MDGGQALKLEAAWEEVERLKEESAHELADTCKLSDSAHAEIEATLARVEAAESSLVKSDVNTARAMARVDKLEAKVTQLKGQVASLR
jgi:hypothetical protein